MRRTALALLLFAAMPLQAANDRDAEALRRIRLEAAQRSQVMEVAALLTDVFGSRLTGSPAARAAGEYARDKLREWGIGNARLEPWSFGPGWSNERFWIRLVAPQPQPLIGYPRAWTPSTNGPVQGQAVLVSGSAPADLRRYRGTLRGKFAVLEPEPERAALAPQPARLGDADLEALARPPEPAAARTPRTTAEARDFMRQRDRLLVEEGALAALEPSRLVRNGTVLVARSGARRPDDPPMVPTVTLAIEHYGRIVRLLQRGVPVQLEMDVSNAIHEGPDSFNVLAEIPGTDEPDEVVMLGAHLDSWHAGTGATDNAAGCAVVMEALRVLKATGLRLRRTVRLALWTGEEQGLLGSRAYVAGRLVDPATATSRPELARLAVYLNLDAGAGAIRGVFLQGNDAAGPQVAAWLLPLHDLGATTVASRNAQPGGSDHQSFDDVGVPAFQFIQDPGDYEDRTHTHHTNMDVFEALSDADLRTNAAIVAAFAYQAANDDGRLPGKPPAARRGGATEALR